MLAFRIDSALGDVTGPLLSAARLVRIAGCARIAGAPVGQSVFAVRVLAARWQADGRHYGRNAQQIRFADEERQTDALVGGLVATSSNSAGDIFAAFLAATGHANLRLLARIGRRAHIRNARSAGERISVVSVQTGARGALAGSDALGALSAQCSVAERDAGTAGNGLEARKAATPSGVIFRLAVSVGSARKSSARIDARSLDAGQLTVAIRVGAALGTGLALTADSVRISEQSGRTAAFESAVLVDALSSRTARIVFTFVNVRASQVGVSGVSGFAHAFGRIGGRALAVDSAREPLARTFTFVSVGCVRVVRRWTDALAGLDAFLVGGTFVVVDAADLRGRASAFVRITRQTFRTKTFELARSVDAFSSEGARLGIFSAFVDVLAGSIRLSAESGGTGAVTDASGDRNTFRSGRTGLFTASTIREETSSADDSIRRLTATFDAVAFAAAGIRISVSGRWTGTFVASGQVLADGAESARRFISRKFQTFVDIATQSGRRIADKSSVTDASAGFGGAVNATLFTRRTRVRLTATRWRSGHLFASLFERLAFVSAGALAGQGARVVAADGSGGARIGRTLVDVNASAQGPSGETRRAHTFGNGAEQHALLVGRTAHIFARIWWTTDQSKNWK